jgi:sugar lactone lactonase YvrE
MPETQIHDAARAGHGQPQTTNIAFGGPDWKTLYFTNWNFVGSVQLRVGGLPVPTGKKA